MGIEDKLIDNAPQNWKQFVQWFKWTLAIGFFGCLAYNMEPFKSFFAEEELLRKDSVVMVHGNDFRKVENLLHEVIGELKHMSKDVKEVRSNTVSNSLQISNVNVAVDELRGDFMTESGNNLLMASKLKEVVCELRKKGFQIAEVD